MYLGHKEDQFYCFTRVCFQHSLRAHGRIVWARILCYETARVMGTCRPKNLRQPEFSGVPWVTLSNSASCALNIPQLPPLDNPRRRNIPTVRRRVAKISFSPAKEALCGVTNHQERKMMSFMMGQIPFKNIIYTNDTALCLLQPTTRIPRLWDSQWSPGKEPKMLIEWP